MLTSSTQLQNRSFRVVERTRMSSKCQKIKNARAKRAKILFFIVKYANLCRRRCGCLSSLIILQGRAGYEVIDNQRSAQHPAPSWLQSFKLDSEWLLHKKTPGSTTLSCWFYSGPKRLLSTIFFSELQKCFQHASLLVRSFTIWVIAGLWIDSLCPASQWKCRKSDIGCSAFNSIGYRQKSSRNSGLYFRGQLFKARLAPAIG